MVTGVRLRAPDHSDQLTARVNESESSRVIEIQKFAQVSVQPKQTFGKRWSIPVLEGWSGKMAPEVDYYCSSRELTE